MDLMLNERGFKYLIKYKNLKKYWSLYMYVASIPEHNVSVILSAWEVIVLYVAYKV